MKKKIMVVDDNEDVRNTVETILKLEKFDVIKAEDGADFLEKLKTTKPDLILLDLKMPGMTIEEIFDELGNMHIVTPIILFSASREADAIERLFPEFKEHKNVRDYIEKPFSNEDFVRRVKKALKMK